MRESVIKKGTMEANGECVGESVKLRRKIIQKIMVSEEYQTELRTFDGIFDDATGKLLSQLF